VTRAYIELDNSPRVAAGISWNNLDEIRLRENEVTNSLELIIWYMYNIFIGKIALYVSKFLVLTIPKKSVGLDMVPNQTAAGKVTNEKFTHGAILAKHKISSCSDQLFWGIVPWPWI
jgi:hypothetical protein